MDRIIGVSTFTGFGRNCLAACLCGIIALSAPLAVHADTVNDEAGQRFTLDGTRLIFDGAVEREEGSRSIDHEDAHELRTFLFEHPEIELLEIQSGGGQVTAALDMAAVLVDFEIDTVVTGRCDSACALVFVAGANRTFEKGGRLGFHSASWSRENIKHYYETQREARGWADEFSRYAIEHAGKTRSLSWGIFNRWDFSRLFAHAQRWHISIKCSFKHINIDVVCIA